MATTVIPPGFAQAAIETRHSSYARPSVNVFGLTVPSGGIDPTDLAADVHLAWSTTIRPIQDNETRTQRVRVAIGQDGGPPIIGEYSPPLIPGRTLASLPPAMAVRLTWPTAVGGRRGRGSSFLTWSVGEQDVNELGNIAPAAVTTHQTAAQQFRLEMEEEGMPLVLLHSTGISEVPPPTVITNAGVDPVISNQVRRQIRR